MVDVSFSRKHKPRCDDTLIVASYARSSLPFSPERRECMGILKKYPHPDKSEDMLNYAKRIFAIQIELSLPYFSHPIGCIHSAVKSQISFSEICVTVKLPSLAPSSGTRITSESLTRHICFASKRAIKIGALWRNT